MLLPALVFLVLAAPQEPKPARSDVASTPLPAGDQTVLDAGLKAFARHDYLKAEIEFRKAVEADPQSAAAHFYLGYTWYKMCEPKGPNHPDKAKAAGEFAKAYELDPKFVPVWGKKK